MSSEISQVISEREFNIYKNMAPEKKLQLAVQMYWSAWELKYNYLKRQNPHWNDGQIKAEIRRVFACAGH
ncbi:MAG: hypothetical protein Kow0037_14450 [Calditrichia bacterium]